MADLLPRLVVAESPSLVAGSQLEVMEILTDELEDRGFSVSRQTG